MLLIDKGVVIVTHLKTYDTVYAAELIKVHKRGSRIRSKMSRTCLKSKRDRDIAIAQRKRHVTTSIG